MIPLKGTLFGVLALSAAGCSSTASRTVLENDVEGRLRMMLEVPADERILVTRDYSPYHFPGATFYRTAVQAPGYHTRASRAGVVVVGGEVLAVASEADLGALWTVVGRPSDSADDDAVKWAELLWQTAIIDAPPVVASSAAGLPPGYRSFLEPKDLLSVIEPPRREVTAQSEQLVFFLEAIEGVYEVRVTTRGSFPATVTVTLLMTTDL